MKPTFFCDGRVALYCGDNQTVLPKIPENSIDACVCDPPYHLTSIVKRFGSSTAASAKVGKTGAYARASKGFMGKTWDGGDIAFQPAFWAQVLRVLKPGAYIVAFSSTRTFGRMACAIEDAGFIVHPFVAWIFGQGFPKAHKIVASGLTDLDRETGGWNGWHYGGQALKPAIEPIFMGQKPFAAGLTGTQNVQRHGVGALNIDGCRIGVGDDRASGGGPGANRQTEGWGMTTGASRPDDGRWPANVAHDGSPEVVGAFPDTGPGGFPASRGAGGIATKGCKGQSGLTAGATDAGSAARFFYSAKADADDRLGSKHPTVKPIDLMQWLLRLVTPPGGTVLDPFAGTGTTGEAAWREGCRAVLIEREAEYQADIQRRMKLVLGGPEERQRESIKARGLTADAGPLFGGTDDKSRGGADRFTATSPTRTNDRTDGTETVKA